MATPQNQQPNHPAPSPERRFIQRRVVQPLIQWVPLGGSGWLFASFLLQQDWLQVALTFPVTVVTAVWAAYSRNFVERLSEIYAERGRQDADALTQFLDNLNQALLWQFSGFEAKYLRCQRLDCHDDETTGLKETSGIVNILPLQEVFVPLRLNLKELAAGYGKGPCEGETPEEPEPMLIWDLLRLGQADPFYRQIAIRAWGGYGKTTLLKHVAYVYSSGVYKQKKYRAPKRIPFLLYLTRCWSQLTPAKALNLPELLMQYHLPRLPQGKALNPPTAWINNLLKRGEALVMFDGFDEVPIAERSAVSQWLREQMRQYPDAVFMLTSRPGAYDEHYTAKRPTASFWVEDFQPDQQERFIKQWYLCQERRARSNERNTPQIEHRAQQNTAALLGQIQARRELADLAGNPLLLNMMCRFHRDKHGADLPDRKVELYQDFFELQLARRPKARNIPLLLNSLSQRQEVLQTVALAMMQRATPEDEQGFKQIERDDLLALMAPALAERDADVVPAEFLKQVVDVSELLVQRERNIYEFAHLSFQEFLAAAEVVRCQGESLLYDQLSLDAWKPTLLLYGELTNPIGLIQKCIRRDAAKLAYRLWHQRFKRPSLSQAARQALEALKPELLAAYFQPLETYLANGQWREADEETYRVMIIAVGKDWGDGFTRDELLNFPCEELLTVDGLWVKYSQGKWGFSVQKQIYADCGATLDGSFPSKEIWYDFCDRVGWRKGNSYVNYADLTFDLSISPVGEFPCGGGVSFSSLASRLVNCSK
jgi:hypothetical protein